MSKNKGVSENYKKNYQNEKKESKRLLFMKAIWFDKGVLIAMYVNPLRAEKRRGANIS